MKCTKCGGKIDPKGRYCMECFEPVSSPLSLEEEERPAVPRQAIIAGSGALGLVILVLVILSMRTTPPDKVVMQWLNACASGNASQAVRYTTEDFEMSGGYDRKFSYEKIEQFQADRQRSGLTFAARETKYEKSPHPQYAKVVVTFRYGKNGNYNHDIYLKKDGRDWKILELK